MVPDIAPDHIPFPSNYFQQQSETASTSLHKPMQGRVSYISSHKRFQAW
jgi:hypothetical protein